MRLPLLTAETPYQKPAVESKEFPHQWVSMLVVRLPTADSGMVRIELLPYNRDTGEILGNVPPEVVSTDQLWLAAQEVPEVGQAMGAVLACVGPLKAWLKAKAEAEAAAQNQREE